MSDEHIPQSQPQDELSDEQLEEVTGGDGNHPPPTLTATLSEAGLNKSASKNEVAIES